jgi:hypothetical protein
VYGERVPIYEQQHYVEPPPNVVASAAVRPAEASISRDTRPEHTRGQWIQNPNRECTRTGAAYAFSCMPETTNTTPLVIYQNEASTIESLAWRAQYPEHNINNLDTHGVL